MNSSQKFVQVEVKGIAHITGGGIPGNLSRVLRRVKLGARLDALFPPAPIMKKLQTLGAVENREAFRTWNMGTGMLLVISRDCEANALRLLGEAGVEARVVGQISEQPEIRVVLQDEADVVFER